MNTKNSKVYIGQTVKNPFERMHNHLSDLRRGKHPNNHLQSSFNKYGENDFKLDTLAVAENKDELDKLEIYFINKYTALDSQKGYNIREGGSNGKMSLETRKKISIANTGKKKKRSIVSTIKSMDTNLKNKPVFKWNGVHPLGHLGTDKWLCRYNAPDGSHPFDWYDDPVTAKLIREYIEKEFKILNNKIIVINSSSEIKLCEYCNTFFIKTHHRQKYCPPHIKPCKKYARQDYKAQHEFKRRRSPEFDLIKHSQLGSKGSLSANRLKDFEEEARTVHKALMKIRKYNKARIPSYEYRYEMEKVESMI